MISLLLLVVASLADSEYDRTHRAPTEGLAVVFYSKQFRFTKIADPGKDNERVFFESADASSRNLFLLDKDQNEYFIRDAHSNRRLGCAENTNIYAVPSSSTIWPDQLWKFIGPDADGFYVIQNVLRGWQIATTSTSHGACYDPQWSDGKYFKWRLEDIFKADAMWKSIAELDNTSGVDGKYTYRKTIGYTQSITKSEAKKQSVSQSLTFSASGALKGMNLGAESTTTMTSEFSSSVSNAMSGTFTTQETLAWDVPAHTCLQILQLQVSQDDTMAKIENMNFYGSMTKIRDCPGGEARERSVGWFAEHAECDVQTEAECRAAHCAWTGAYCQSHGEAEKAVSSGSNGVPSETAYYFSNWNKNSCAWATGEQVLDEKQCLSGINSLGWGITKFHWTGNSGSVPKGCSFDPNNKRAHFNANPTGHGRSDLRPLCKSKAYDDKCGCMYAYCEDKYGVGNTGNCCEFYRSNSECKQMNSIAVAEEISSNVPIFVYAFAAVGFGAVMYGASQHYLSGKN